MQKYVLGVGAAATAAVAMALFGTATAAADYVGETYADASEAMGEDGVDPVIATRTGDTLEDDDCIVTAAWTAPFVRDGGDEFVHSEDEMLVSLNCAGGYASATNPRASVASPAGRPSPPPRKPRPLRNESWPRSAPRTSSRSVTRHPTEQHVDAIVDELPAGRG
jgi:hypothetical protein